MFPLKTLSAVPLAELSYSESYFIRLNSYPQLSDIAPLYRTIQYLCSPVGVYHRASALQFQFHTVDFTDDKQIAEHRGHRRRTDEN